MPTALASIPARVLDRLRIRPGHPAVLAGDAGERPPHGAHFAPLGATSGKYATASPMRTLRAEVAHTRHLAEFARLAEANGVDPEAVIEALGGRPAPDVGRAARARVAAAVGTKTPSGS